MVIRRVPPLPAAKTMSLVYAAIGVIVGACITLVGFAGGFKGQEIPFGGAFGLAAIIILPIVYGLIGFLAFLLVASLYNWAAGLVGGIELEIEGGERVN
jgi:hypothetical protein